MVQPKFEYDLDYYTGAQAAMFFEDILIDEVTSLQWTIQQAKVPIYGYASQLYDEMARGTIIVQGSFSINFVEAGYLWTVLNHIKKEGKQSSSYPGSSMVKLSNEHIDDINKEAIEAWMLDNNANNASLSSSAKLLDAYKKLLQDPDTRNLDVLQGYVNDYVWGSEVPTVTGKGYDEKFADSRRTDRHALNGFDIYVKFAQNKFSNPTIQKIEDVHLLGKAQTIVIDENPVQEVYSFYAKNVI